MKLLWEPKLPQVLFCFLSHSCARRYEGSRMAASSHWEPHTIQRVAFCRHCTELTYKLDLIFSTWGQTALFWPSLQRLLWKVPSHISIVLKDNWQPLNLTSSYTYWVTSVLAGGSSFHCLVGKTEPQEEPWLLEQPGSSELVWLIWFVTCCLFNGFTANES